MLDKKTLAGKMDHTLLKAFATEADIMKLCDEAMSIGAATVCVNPVFVAAAKSKLSGSTVKVCTVVGFPLGANTSVIKAAETKDAIANGADEIDMVINVGTVKSGDRDRVYDDIRAVVNAADTAPVKVIIETCYLTDEEKIWVCKLAAKAGACFVKTSTGFGTSGATAHDVALMKKSVPPHVLVKAAGGMRTLADVIPVLEAGADRLGVSASLSILDEL